MRIYGETDNIRKKYIICHDEHYTNINLCDNIEGY